MSEPAAARLTRLVQLIAELSRREREEAGSASLGDLAERFGATAAQIADDIRTLAAVNDHPDHAWMSSLRVLQEGDRIALWSSGHFQRPLRLTPEEAAAIQIGLVLTGEAGAVSEALAQLLQAGAGAPATWHAGESVGPQTRGTADLAARAGRECRCLEMEYARSDGSVSSRVIEVSEVVEAEGRCYLIAWCRLARGRRHFRADRVLAARLLDERFEPRPGMPEDRKGVFRVPETGPDRVRVRFTPRVARWLIERYPDAEREADGSVVVTYEVSDVHWLVRTVLQYGAEAEVVAPPAYREAMRRAVA